MGEHHFRTESIIGLDLIEGNLSYFTDAAFNFTDNRINRNFQMFVTERSQIENGYSELFREIKSKMYSASSDECALTNEQTEIFNKKYSTSLELKTNIDTIKKLIVEFHDKKHKLECDLEERQKKYQLFSESILNSVKYMHDITSSTSETSEDSQLKEILLNRINWYYSQLKIDSLKQEYSEVVQEYSYLKGIINQISTVMPCGICQICLDQQVCFFIDPCGHTLCGKCKDAIRNNTTCSFCRVKTNKFLKMYL